MSPGLGLLVTAIFNRFGPMVSNTEPNITLLTSLLISELGFIITVVGLFVAVRKLTTGGIGLQMMLLAAGNALLASALFYTGITL